MAVKKARFTGKNTEARYIWGINYGTFEEIENTSGPVDNIKPKRPQRQRKEEDVF